MFCNNCGKENPDNSKFCRGCGAALNNSAPQQTFIQQPAGDAAATKAKGRNISFSTAIVVILVSLAIGLAVWLFIFGGYKKLVGDTPDIVTEELHDFGYFMIRADKSMVENEPIGNIRTFTIEEDKARVAAVKEKVNSKLTDDFFKELCNLDRVKRCLSNATDFKEISKDGDVITFNFTNDGQKGYGYAKFKHQGQDLYLFVFYCPDSSTNTYKDRFARWADSITISPE